jgi:hypothetical protein
MNHSKIIKLRQCEPDRASKSLLRTPKSFVESDLHVVRQIASDPSVRWRTHVSNTSEFDIRIQPRNSKMTFRRREARGYFQTPSDRFIDDVKVIAPVRTNRFPVYNPAHSRFG